MAAHDAVYRERARAPQVSYALDPYAARGSVRTLSRSNQSGFDVTVTLPRV